MVQQIQDDGNNRHCLFYSLYNKQTNYFIQLVKDFMICKKLPMIGCTDNSHCCLFLPHVA